MKTILETMQNRYFHVQSNILIQNKWKIGDEIKTCEKYNRFFDSITKSIGKRRNETKLLEYSRKIINRDESSQDNLPNAEPESYKQIVRINELENLSCDLYRALSQTNKLIRENIYESIRKKDYSHRPSRITGIWLTTYEFLNNWHEGFASGSRIYEVEIIHESAIFEADADLIVSDDRTLNELDSLAHKYWKGNHISDEVKLKEILFNGTLKVINEFQSVEEIKYT